MNLDNLQNLDYLQNTIMIIGFLFLLSYFIFSNKTNQKYTDIKNSYNEDFENTSSASASASASASSAGSSASSTALKQSAPPKITAPSNLTCIGSGSFDYVYSKPRYLEPGLAILPPSIKSVNGLNYLQYYVGIVNSNNDAKTLIKKYDPLVYQLVPWQDHQFLVYVGYTYNQSSNIKNTFNSAASSQIYQAIKLSGSSPSTFTYTPLVNYGTGTLTQIAQSIKTTLQYTLDITPPTKHAIVRAYPVNGTVVPPTKAFTPPNNAIKSIFGSSYFGSSLTSKYIGRVATVEAASALANKNGAPAFWVTEYGDVYITYNLDMSLITPSNIPISTTDPFSQLYYAKCLFQ